MVNDSVITIAAREGHIEEVKYVYTVVIGPRNGYYEQAIKEAAANGRLEIVWFLLSNQPALCTELLLVAAAMHGQTS